MRNQYGQFASINKQDIITDLLFVYKDNKNLFNTRIYKQYGKYSYDSIQKYFGSWANMLKELNLPVSKNRKPFSREEAIQKAKELFALYGKMNTYIFRKYSGISDSSIRREFGNSTKFFDICNIKTCYESYKYTDEELKEAIKNLYEEFGFINKKLIKRELNIPNATIIKRIGKIEELCDLLNIKNFLICEKFEFILNIINDFLNEKPILEFTNDKLINPKTGNQLRIDAYYLNNNLAIEYDGEQHFKYKPLWHKSKGHFLYRQYLDKLKEVLLFDINIPLIRFKYNEILTKEEIEDRIKLIITK